MQQNLVNFRFRDKESPWLLDNYRTYGGYGSLMKV